MHPTRGARAGEGESASLAPFLTKTYELVDDAAVDDVISWGEGTTARLSWWGAPRSSRATFCPSTSSTTTSPASYASLTPKDLRRWCRIGGSSGTRASAGARGGSSAKSTGGRCAHCPRSQPRCRSNPRGILEIRSRSCPSPPPPPPPPPSHVDLVEENERLRTENAQLSRELGDVRCLCDNIFRLVFAYAAVEGTSSEAPPPPPLQLFPTRRPSPEDEGEEEEEEGAAAVMFGVPIGGRREPSDRVPGADPEE